MTEAQEGRRPADRSAPLLGFAVSSFVVGAALMVFFESAITRVLGLAALFAFLVAGVFLVAAPAFLEVDDHRHGARPPPRRTPGRRP